MPLHKRLMGGFKKPDDSQILLHDIYAVLVIFYHFNNFFGMAFGLFEICQ